jgi:hypothetical protein
MTEAIENLHDNLYEGLVKFKENCKDAREIEDGLKMAKKAINDSQIERSIKDIVIRVLIKETRKVFPEINLQESEKEE